MKKSFIAIIALLVTGITSAQSKSDLLKEFQSLEEKLGEISLKYDKKLQNFQEGGSNEVIGDDIKEGDFKDEDFKDFGGDDKNEKYNEDDIVKETMKMFVEMYNDNDKNKDTMYAELEDDKPSAKDKEFIKVMKEYETETAKIEKKMYEIAKKYLSKK